MVVDRDAILDALTLTPVGEDSYRVANLDVGGPVVFGRQILAQSAVAGLIGQAGIRSRPFTPCSPRRGR
jgi:acyl-CoA thioesterase